MLHTVITSIFVIYGLTSALKSTILLTIMHLEYYLVLVDAVLVACLLIVVYLVMVLCIEYWYQGCINIIVVVINFDFYATSKLTNRLFCELYTWGPVLNYFQYFIVPFYNNNNNNNLFQKTKGPWPSSQYNTQCIQS